MRDIAVRPIVWTGLGFAAVIATVVASVFVLLHAGGMPPGGQRLAGVARLAAPRLASAPQDELARYRREKQARLRSAGWEDREKGVAHIPIDDAMELLLGQRRQGAKP